MPVTLVIHMIFIISSILGQLLFQTERFFLLGEKQSLLLRNVFFEFDCFITFRGNFVELEIQY